MARGRTAKGKRRFADGVYEDTEDDIVELDADDGEEGGGRIAHSMVSAQFPDTVAVVQFLETHRSLSNNTLADSLVMMDHESFHSTT